MTQSVNIRKYGDAMVVGALAAIRDMVPFTAARALRPTDLSHSGAPAAARPPQAAFSRPSCQST